jgi:Flp pilus assembly protein TadB
MAPDTMLTPYERKSWKKLQRQLEADGSRRAGPRSTSRSVVLAIAAVAVPMLLVSGVIGGRVAVAAVALYLCLTLTLWGLARLVWRT